MEVKSIDKEEYKRRKKVTDTYLKHMKSQSWYKKTEESIQSNQFFKLFNNLNKAGKIWVDYENIIENKNKKPKINKSIEKTVEEWENL